MKTFIKGTLTLCSFIFAANCFADDAYVVTHDRAVARINDKGEQQLLSEPGFAMDVSYSTSGILWALTTDQGKPDVGGNRVAFLKGTKWTTLTMSNGKEAFAVSGDKNGNVWFIDGDNRSIWNANQKGKILKSLESSGFFKVSAEVINDYVWAISRRPVAKGNPIMYHKIGSGSWERFDKITGIALSGEWIVTHEERIAEVDINGSLKHVSPTDFARDVSYGNKSKRLWAVSVEPHQGGGSVLKIKNKSNNEWVVVPNTGVRRVSAE